MRKNQPKQLLRQDHNKSVRPLTTPSQPAPTQSLPTPTHPKPLSLSDILFHLRHISVYTSRTYSRTSERSLHSRGGFCLLAAVDHTVLLLNPRLPQLLQMLQQILLVTQPIRTQRIRPQQEVISQRVRISPQQVVRQRQRPRKLIIRSVQIDQPDILERLLSGQPLTAFPQQPPHQIPRRLAVARLNLLTEGELPPHNVADGLAVILRLEGRHPLHHLEHRYAQRPQIDPLIIPTPLEHLRRAVVGRPSEGQQLLLTPPMQQLLTDPEIDDLDAVLGLVEENVLGFDVAVADVETVDVAEGLEQLVHDQFELGFAGTQETKEVGEGEVVHDQVALLGFHLEEQGVVGDHVLMLQMLDIREVLLQKQNLLPIQTHSLHRPQHARLPTEALLHDPMRALPNLLAHLVPIRKNRPPLLLRVHTQRIHMRKHKLRIGNGTTGFSTAVLLQFEFELQSGLLEDGQGGQRQADVGHVGATLLQFGLRLHRIIDPPVNHQN